MEIIILIIAVLVIGGVIIYSKNPKTLDVNNDGKVDAEDVKEAAKVVKTEATKAVKTARTYVKKSSGKKPAAKKTTTTRAKK